jgi:hypothetical protein
MTIDINVLLAIGIMASLFLHYKQSKKNQEEKKIEYHTYNYYQAEIYEDEESRF